MADRKKEEKHGRQKKEKILPRVRLSSQVEEFLISGAAGDGFDDDEISEGETTITLTKSDERYRQYMKESDDERNEKLAIEKGWCTKNGIPWNRNQMPKDEAALLKQGIIDRSGTRSTYFSLDSNNLDEFSTGYPKFYDEIELLKEGLVDKNGHHHQKPKVEIQKGNFMLPNEPIEIAELNSRGFIDQNGKIHYQFPFLISEKDSGMKKKRSLKTKKKAPSSPRVQICESHESESIAKTPLASTSDFEKQQDSETRGICSKSRDYNSKKPQKSKKLSCAPSSSTSETAANLDGKGIFGTIQCKTGHGKDAGNIKYAVTNDGRNYELDTNDGHYLRLGFNKKHSYLILD